MSGFVSVGDLSRSAYLRQANAALKLRLSELTQEAASGMKSDIPRATNGNLGRLAQVEDRLARLTAHGRNGALALSELDGLQGALGAIGDLATLRAGELVTAPGLMDEATLNLRSRQAGQDFQAVVRLMNVDVGGRFVLSGTAVQTPPLDDPAAILQQVEAQVAGLTSPGDIIAALDAWFDAPAGGGGFIDAHYGGNADPVVTSVSPESTVTHALTAVDPAFRGILAGMAIAAIAGNPDLALSRDDKASLMAAAGTRIGAGNDALTSERSRVGMNQQQVEQAVARNGAARTALSIARSDILAADPYDTASALTQTEANLQNLYALTSRLSRLSLADYLR